MIKGIILSSSNTVINHSMSNQSAGVFFYSNKTNRYLYLLRTDNKNPGNWGIPGGKIEDDETLFEGITRECKEEIGLFPNYHTFFCEVVDEFVPILNEEHCGYAWVGDNQYPKPLHPGLFSTVNFDVVQDKLKTLTKKET